MTRFMNIVAGTVVFLWAGWIAGWIVLLGFAMRMDGGG